ncbi:kinase-like protein [Lepidopterella palustris CBS 459.81]|uniref:Kinase-like protein n=1 Tax=Lepidopterella palustris CBS 459.81 TaxID=1314670 RepID=A0A8E2DYK5_9PEZI|nr:kinase-like protein [Lepidopterella palustris CBS 459.81]
MKIHPSAQGISLAIRALDSTITPKLTDKAALAAAEVVRHVLTDLLKRQGPAIKLLQELIAEGKALEAEILEAAEKKANSDGIVNDKTDFESLAEEHEQLTIRIVELCSHLSSTDDHRAPALLRRAAEWEHAYYAKIPAVQAPLYGDDETSEGSISAPPLSKEYLEKFLISERGELEVSSFAPMTGGHGKQTYLCDVVYADGKKEELVVRKMDPAPIVLRSMYLVEQEYFFLKCLSKTDYPCPKPFDLARKTDSVDGSFFTMSKMPGSGASMFLKTGEKNFSEKMLLQLAELLAKLHATPIETFAEYFEVYEEPAALKETVEERYTRSIKGWEKYVKDVEHLPSPYMTWIFDWLNRNIPKDTRRPVPTHGDFSVHNVLVEGDDITAVLDWECADFGSPELDLAYCQPLVSQAMPWEKFVARYLESGGQEIREENFAFCQAYSVLRVMLAFNRATYNLQSSLNQDIRFHMVELGYQSVFMGMGLTYTVPPPATEPNDTNPSLKGEAPKVNGHAVTYPPELTLDGGNTLKVHGPEANVRQKPGPAANWQESVVLVWWDNDNHVGGFHRLGHEPNVEGGGRATLWTNLISPDGIFKRTQSIPLREKDLLPNGGYGSGDDTCTVEYIDGAHIWTINDTDTSARLVVKDDGPNIDCFPKKGAMSTEFATAHFDVPVNISGTFTMKGKSYSLNGLGLRDHAWGPRDWGNTVYSHRWVCGSCGPAFSFVAVSWHSTDDKIANFGWVVRDGQVTLARSVDLLTYMEMDSCINRGGRVKFSLTSGEMVEVECNAVPAKCIVCYHHDIACVDRICKFKSSNGFEGFANFESSSNIQFGKRRPVNLVDGVIEDGFTPAGPLRW